MKQNFLKIERVKRFLVFFVFQIYIANAKLYLSILGKLVQQFTPLLCKYFIWISKYHIKHFYTFMCCITWSNKLWDTWVADAKHQNPFINNGISVCSIHTIGSIKRNNLRIHYWGERWFCGYFRGKQHPNVAS